MLPEELVTEISHEIRDLINGINRTWLKGDPADLEGYLHELVVIQPPGGAPRVHGREACIASYKAFTDQAKVTRFEPRDAEIDVFGDTVVATYRFRIVYELNARTHDEDGGEVLVFLRDGDAWRVVWRTVTP